MKTNKGLLVAVGLAGVFFANIAFAQSAPSANYSISVSGVPGTAYATGQTWTLQLTSDLPNTSFSLCASANGSPQNCSPWGTTDANGSWSGTGAFETSSIGSWTEWALFPSANFSSNQIGFTVSQASASTAVTREFALADKGYVLVPFGSGWSDSLADPASIQQISVRLDLSNVSPTVSGNYLLEAWCNASASQISSTKPDETNTGSFDAAPVIVWLPGCNYTQPGTYNLQLLAAVPDLTGTVARETIPITIGTAAGSGGTTTASPASSSLLTSSSPLAISTILQEFSQELGTLLAELTASAQSGTTNSALNTSIQTEVTLIASQLSQELASLHVAPAPAPTLTGVQGYDPVYDKYTDYVITPDKYLILYGTFAPSGNTVTINGQAFPASSVVYESANQINVSLDNLTTTISPSAIAVSNANGSSQSMNVTITGQSAGSSTAPPASSLDPAIGVYIWGKQSIAGTSDPISNAVNFAALKGFGTVRLSLSPRYAIDYGISASCDSSDSLKQIFQSGPFEQALSNPSISTIILTVDDHTTFSDCATHHYLNPSFYTAANTAALIQEYQDFTLYLYQTYRNTGKKFIISNWEGDNDLYCGGAYSYGTDASFRSSCDQNYAASYNGNANVGQSIQGMQLWLLARNTGVLAGRSAAAAQGLSGVSVYTAGEFNIVHALHDNGYQSMLYDVLPQVPMDYFSYSSYESINNQNPGQTLSQDLQTAKNVLGSNNVMIGEFGYNRDQWGSTTTQTDLGQVINSVEGANLPYGIVWQLFDQPQAEGDFGVFNDSGQPETYRTITSIASKPTASPD